MQGSRRPTAPRGAILRAILLLALPALTLAGSAAAQEVELAWQFRPGDVHVYLQTNSTRSESPMGEVTHAQTVRVRQEVLRVGPDGLADVRVTHEAVRVEQDGPMGPQVFDSETDEAPVEPGLKMMGHMVGTGFRMTMAPDGTVRAVSGMDEFIEAILAAVREEAPEMGEMFVRMFDAEQMEAHMQQSAQPLPGGPVAPGAEWSAEAVTDLPFGTARMTTVYRLDEVVTRDGRRVALIGVSGEMGPIEMAADNPMAGMMEFSGGDFGGGMEFDVDRGLVLRYSTSTAVTASAMGMSMRIETTNGMELVQD